MLRFSTTTPFHTNSDVQSMSEVKPLIVPNRNCNLKDGTIKGKEAFIVGEALELAGFHLPCFYDGDITELDKPDGEIYMVLPSGEYPITATLKEDNNYYLNLKMAE